MKYLFIFLITLGLANVCYAEEHYEQSVAQPNLELVLSIYEFCLSQYSMQDNNSNNQQEQIENAILHCINDELSISSYQTFSSYQAVITFIDKNEGE